MIEKKKVAEIKNELHPRSKHKSRYDFDQLIKVNPNLKDFVKPNDYGNISIDFFNADAVLELNKAILADSYGIKNWNVPKGFLCPPIPGRADYIHNVADLLSNNGEIPTGKNVKVFDLGTGASCIYPLLGHSEYGWSFIGSESEDESYHSAKNVVNDNLEDTSLIEVRKQSNYRKYFNGVLKPGEKVDVSVCNPPFHSSEEEASRGSLRKLRNLKKKKNVKLELNFGGQQNELWCKGGERRFTKDMIYESRQFEKQCMWFTTLVSRDELVPEVLDWLDAVGAKDVKEIQMGQGNKISRVVAWTFLSSKEQEEWKKDRW
ncbi:MAG: 23S rRNA (adenine1618-N6)-methyltransferase [Flavobacteriales bacterium]|jgi:23S rRNA (adenine1618-N6)-methyltransferase